MTPHTWPSLNPFGLHAWALPPPPPPYILHTLLRCHRFWNIILEWQEATECKQLEVIVQPGGLMNCSAHKKEKLADIDHGPRGGT
jgi:hypothetical protein